jgi:hypothetical protein
MKVIDVFTVLFLGYSFYSYSNQTTISATALAEYRIHLAFLINENSTKTEKTLQFYHVAGTLMRTLARMMFFLNALYSDRAYFSKHLFAIIIPIFFIVLVCLQVCKVFKKYGK